MPPIIWTSELLGVLQKLLRLFILLNKLVTYCQESELYGDKILFGFEIGATEIIRLVKFDT